MEFAGDFMDNNINLQIKRLIEVDKRAVELEHKRENELKQLNQSNRLELESIESELKSTKEEAKRTYENMVMQAQKEVEAVAEDTNQKLQKMENTINLEVDAIASEWWNKILNSLK
jgi:dsDNA-specific endonuclease/ATPase MutS2